MIKKSDFIFCANTLREYSQWELSLYKNGIDLLSTPANSLAENLILAMCDFDLEWAYDKKLDFNWIVEWSCGESDCYVQRRHGRVFELDSASALYDFLVFMNEKGWED